MSTQARKDQFTAFNLDPALAETVEAAPEQQVIEGILRLENPGEIPQHFTVVSRFNRVCTGRFAAGHVWTIRRHPNVVSLKATRPLGIHDEAGDVADLVLPETGTPAASAAPYAGRGCIVAALDFGLDFTHPNFLNPDGMTRLVAFWNQGAPYDPARPNRFGYGRVYSQEEINAALRASDPYQALGYHPAISDTGSGSHGTHTLDIAAGNGRAGGARAGAASAADLMFVHLSTPRLDTVGDLGDSVRMLEALDYVDRTAQGRPWVVNLSVGRTAGSHDGTSLVEQGMHELLRLGPGRAIVQSAGNYRSADLAVHGWLRDGEHRDLEWIIDPRDTTANEVDAWYSGKDRFVVAIRPPDGGGFVEARLGEVADLRHNGNVVGRIYHRNNDPNNRDNQVEVFLYRGAPAGAWTVRLIGDYVISGRFHAWIERDLARPGAQSRFDAKITSQSYTLGTIATSPLVITVGAYDANAVGSPQAPFSSCGPTRDERPDKPELLAPGVGVVAARSNPRGSPRQEGLLVARSGTSMAAPHVTGTVAAMLEAAGRPVSIDEIRDCLQRSAEPVADAEHPDCCAWGRLNTAGAIREIRGLSEATPVSAPRGGVFAPSALPMTSEPDADVAIEDFSNTSEMQEIEVSSDEGSLMNSDTADCFLDRAEHALRSSSGGRRQSETSFFQGLLRDIGAGAFAVVRSPAELLRAILHNRPLMQRMRDVLDIVGMPSQQPQDALRPGDWMLRAVPGTGDVGHVSVLASAELLTQPMLASKGIEAESMRPGYYGSVIEAGAFPHSRARPFARRLLDARGRVPPDSLLLRPRFLQLNGAGEADDNGAPIVAPAAVSPVITPASLIVVVKKPHTTPARRAITLRTSAAFAGTGFFTRSNAHVDFFTAAFGGTRISFNGRDNAFTGAQLTAGVQLFAQGASPSAALNDVQIRLALRPGAGPVGSPATAQMTAVEVTLEICKSRTAAGTDPVPLSASDKINTGRFVQLQDGGNNAGRAMLIVRQARPAAFAGKLVLTPVEAPADARLQVFASEAGGAALTLPHEIDASTIPAAGVKLWAQGRTVSGAIRDTGLRLGVKNVEPVADRVVATVVQFTQIQATIRPTPANTARAGIAAPADHTFSSTSISEDFTVNRPLVLTRNAQPDIQLEVTCAPAGVPIRWQAIRNPLDHASLGRSGDVPALRQDRAEARRARLNTNQKGSFRIRAYIDTNGTSTFQDREPSIPLNLILANATVVADNSQAQPDPTTVTTSFNGAGDFQVANGSWTAGLPRAGMAMELVADVTGGGADGLLGLDRVFSGLVNMVQVRDVVGTYRDATAAPPTNHRLRFIAASNTAGLPATFGGRPLFQPTDPAPVLFALPLLDTGRTPPGVGAVTATMTRSGPHASAARPVGQRWTIQCIDSPGFTFPRTHPVNGSAVLRQAHYHYHFIACFCFWTNISASRASTGDTAERTYSVLRIVDWKIAGDWTIAYPPAPSAPTATVTTAHRIRVARRTTVNPIGRAQDHHVEVRPPSGIQIAAFDGSH